MQFSSLNIISPILRALDEEGYSTPTPIQAQAIPPVLEGNDLLGCAQTGTGKTAAFSIPILQLLSAHPANDKRRKIRSLIVTPTRELAIQIDESLKAYGRHTPVVSTVVFGGVGQQPQVNALQRGVDVLVATPGRLLDLMAQGYVTLRDIEIFVLDEADRMLDMGFIHDVRRIIKELPHKRQSLFFSATMPPEIVKLADTILVDPVKVEVSTGRSTAETIQQYIYFVDRVNKNALLVDLMNDPSIKTALVFTRTKYGADKVAKMLTKHGIKAEAIHGDKAQNARQRALAGFKAQTLRVLVATDIAARGIDVDDLQFVINYEVPNIPETYVHRIGRTGRAGANGTAFSFCDQEEKAYLKDIEKLIGLKIPEIENTKYPFAGIVQAPAPKVAHQKRETHQRPGNNRKAESSNAGKGGFGKTREQNAPKRNPEHSARPATRSQQHKSR